MCNCVVKISSTNQDVFASSESRRLRSSSSGMEAEDDGPGPVPMEVGAMKGIKETKARRVTAKESMANVSESTTKATSQQEQRLRQRQRERKRKRKEKQRKRTRKRREASAKFEIPGLLQVMWQMGHKASECWQGYVQAVEEVPSFSAGSVAPSAATTPPAAKTAASIQAQ